MKTNNGIDNMASQTQDGAARLAKDASATAEDFMGKARDTLANAGEKLAGGYELARDEAKKAEREFESMVKRNPLIALTAAAGLGWAVGRYLSNNNRH